MTFRDQPPGYHATRHGQWIVPTTFRQNGNAQPRHMLACTILIRLHACASRPIPHRCLERQVRPSTRVLGPGVELGVAVLCTDAWDRGGAHGASSSS